jgi:two-component system chemotaxis response regulator CheB
MNAPPFRAVVMGCSAGGLAALRTILPRLPATFPLPVIVVAHAGPTAENLLPGLLQRDCPLPVEEAREGAPARPCCIFLAPPDYHLLMEADATFSLSVDAKVRNVRPSIDVLFCSAAHVYGESLLAVILTGANDDGARGLEAVRAAGGFCLVQDPADAYAATMPEAAIATGAAHWIAPVDWLAPLIMSLCSVLPPRAPRVMSELP